MINASFYRMAACAIAAAAFPALALLLSGCSGGTAGDRANRGPFKVNQISTGLGQVFPYRIRQVDSQGNPTPTIVNIETIDTLKANVNANNGVLPVTALATTATLPNGSPGNQFLVFRFSHKLRIDSILSDQLANQTNSGLTTAVSLVTYNPTTESTSTIPGRGFVGGYTFYNESGELVLREAVRINSGGNVEIVDARADGFPLGFTGDIDLVEPSSFTFIPDTDNNLTTFETFPTGFLLRLVVTNAVLDSENKVLETEVTTATTVGPDPNPADVLGFSPGRTLQITPGNNDVNVDPTTTILVRFNKPVQPGDVGAFFTTTNLVPPSGGMTLSVTAAAQTFPVIYYADPLNYADLSNYRIRPAYTLPGQSTVDVRVNQTAIRDLNTRNLGNTVNTPFTTGDGPGIINAPVAPDVVYIGVGGSRPGVQAIDLNGLGQGTGDINNTRWPLNPNIGAPGVSPVLAPGRTNLDAGSAGVLTLVKDSNGSTLLLRSPQVGQIGDIHIGCPLDLVFNNENINRNATRANMMNPVSLTGTVGNSITVPPHPNPPRLLFPPPNPARSIFGEEPTVTSSQGPPGVVVTTNPPCNVSPTNLLKTGNPYANQSTQVGIYGHLVEAVFYGPQPPPASPPPPTPFCPLTSRQQVGHFLYVLDRDNRQVLVVNSNRFTVLDTIKLTDPFSMAMAPNLRVLAVTNFASSRVSFIDVNPLSDKFHQVIGETRVERGPTSIAWQPDGEDILVVSPGANAVTVVRALDFTVRRTIAGFLNNPIDVAVTPRYQTTGYASGIYFAYILNANGSVAIYESGPDGVNGYGFNDVVGIVPNTNFRRPRGIKLDYNSNNSAAFIAHVEEGAGGTAAQISRLELTASPIGQIPISPNSGGFILPPTFRQKEWTVTQRFGGLNATTPVKDLMSGTAIVDFAVDEMWNYGAAGDQVTPFNSAVPLSPMLHSEKSAMKIVGGGVVQPYQPKLMFVALGDSGKVDVFEINTGRKVRTIEVPGVSVVATYWRQ
jgi:hypothetical protein